MGDEAFMKTQIEDKIAQGFSCIKLKIGAIDFDKEIGLLRFIRANFDENSIEIRVDANGAFSENEALHNAAISGNRELVNYFIEQGANPSPPAI